jgi:zinc transporter 7
MRVLSAQAGGAGHSHSHSHSHSHVHEDSTAKSSSIENTDTSNIVSRSKTIGEKVEPVTPVEPKKEVNPSLKLSAYLNLFGDFTHNITDGLAMAASFYSSPALGAVTTIATFCHEIPHEVSPCLLLREKS